MNYIDGKYYWTRPKDSEDPRYIIWRSISAGQLPVLVMTIPGDESVKDNIDLIVRSLNNNPL